MIEEIEHHPIMKNFKPWEGKCDSDFVVDFLGVFTRKDYIINSRWQCLKIKPATYSCHRRNLYQIQINFSVLKNVHISNFRSLVFDLPGVSNMLVWFMNFYFIIQLLCD